MALPAVRFSLTLPPIDIISAKKEVAEAYAAVVKRIERRNEELTDLLKVIKSLYFDKVLGKEDRLALDTLKSRLSKVKDMTFLCLEDIPSDTHDYIQNAILTFSQTAIFISKLREILLRIDQIDSVYTLPSGVSETTGIKGIADDIFDKTLDLSIRLHETIKKVRALGFTVNFDESNLFIKLSEPASNQMPVANTEAMRLAAWYLAKIDLKEINLASKRVEVIPKYVEGQATFDSNKLRILAFYLLDRKLFCTQLDSFFAPLRVNRVVLSNVGKDFAVSDESLKTRRMSMFGRSSSAPDQPTPKFPIAQEPPQGLSRLNRMSKRFSRVFSSPENPTTQEPCSSNLRRRSMLLSQTSNEQSPSKTISDIHEMLMIEKSMKQTLYTLQFNVNGAVDVVKELSSSIFESPTKKKPLT